MANQPNTPQSIPVPGNLAAILQAAGLPMPSGADENGNPYWQIDGQTVYWAQMQQYLWLSQQSRQGKGGAKSGSPEAIPTLSLPEVSLDGAPDTKLFEAQLEKGIEQQRNQPEQGMERGVEQADQQVATTKAAAKSTSQNSYLGDSAPLTQVDPGNPNSINNFIQGNMRQPDTSSNLFLAHVLQKVLRALSLKS